MTGKIDGETPSAKTQYRRTEADIDELASNGEREVTKQDSKAVSYTHLDVYKRQVLSSCSLV